MRPKVTIVWLGLMFLLCPVHGQAGKVIPLELIESIFKSKPNSTTPASGTIVTESPNVVKKSYKACGLDKECVPRHLCLDGVVSKHGVGVIDFRLDDAVCTYDQICCDQSRKTTVPVVSPKPPIVHQGCGWRNEIGVGFKITGAYDNEAEFAEFPWMVAIVRSMDVNGEIAFMYVCGGSLIAKNVVLTGAHCVIKIEPNELIVRAGEWDTKSENEILPHVDRRVHEIIRHEQFHKGAGHNDVALLILNEPFEWQENIRPICLPESNINVDNQRCYATGWGKDNFNREGQYQTILKKIDLPIVPHDQCEENLRQTRLGLRYELHESFICAGGEKGKDTCKGDGGSPLVCPLPGTTGRFYQAGIVAWGIECGQENIPGVYANVPHLRSWISEKLSAKGISYEDFTP
ncbi:phenoloxidase-activating factor 2-like [Musca vetustissima]|uniref:phenoloxidase-activating factor 2-like n=1 Tax=Musca vetustissima TaxID=27455 RepID=UPI002AB701E8|nr:phenoloxidase-activating factor 2-like [Musca vetustissima]